MPRGDYKPVKGDYGYYMRKSLRDYWRRDFKDRVRWSLVQAIRTTFEDDGVEREIAESNTRDILAEACRFVEGKTPAAEDPKLKKKLIAAAEAMALIANMDANANRLIRRQLFEDDAWSIRPFTFDYIEERPPLSEIIATANIPAYEAMVEGAQRIHARVAELASAYRRKPGVKTNQGRYDFFAALIVSWKRATDEWPLDWEDDTFVADAKAPKGTPRPPRAQAPIFRIARLLVAEISRRTGMQPPCKVSSRVFSTVLRDVRMSDYGPMGPVVVTPRKRATKSDKVKPKKRK